VLGRIVIDDVRPRTPSGRFPPKVAEGERFAVSADVFVDGHLLLAGRVRTQGPAGGWTSWPLRDVGNDRWEADGVHLAGIGRHDLVVEAWVDRYATWRHEIEAKVGAGVDVAIELEEGAGLLRRLAVHAPVARRAQVLEAADGLARTSCSLDVRLNAALDDAVGRALEGVALPEDLTEGFVGAIWVDRPKALFSAWYEVFPRSEGGFAGVAARLADIAAMGFDVVYLPPIHPIGRTARKGPDNALVAGPTDVGSPWAIGGPEGGHTAIHPDLGTLEDFRALVEEAKAHGMEIALDYALQCSPDHPWVSQHPEWFHHRPDGAIKYAENPPKRYEDIYPINFWPSRDGIPDDGERLALWQACRSILDYWIDQGVRFFRVDNPHTKPMAFWSWLIQTVQRTNPDVLFLAEAFTRPKVMAALAEVGFSQSYTYFTWRTERWELREYALEVTAGPTADYMRPNFWPNTPDILSGPLRDGSLAAFRLRALLAATLVPSWGVYRGFEHGENQPASPANEEYRGSEKYELKERPWGSGAPLGRFLGQLNAIRRAHPALQRLRGLTFHDGGNERIITYSRVSDDGLDVVLCVVNLDPDGVQQDTIALDLEALGIVPGASFDVHDALSGTTYTWTGANPYVRLDPSVAPAHIFVVTP
jgi:starch synthase (maltosyl-transferring)